MWDPHRFKLLSIYKKGPSVVYNYSRFSVFVFDFIIFVNRSRRDATRQAVDQSSVGHHSIGHVWRLHLGRRFKSFGSGFNFFEHTVLNLWMSSLILVFCKCLRHVALFGWHLKYFLFFTLAFFGTTERNEIVHNKSF